MRLQNRSRVQSLGACAKGYEILAVLLAVIALMNDFWVQKLRDRGINNAWLVAEAATLTPRGHKNKALIDELAIMEIVKILRKEDSPLQATILQTAILQGADLPDAILQTANLEGANFEGADLEDAKLFRADLTGADLTSAFLKSARNLTQSMLDSAKPSPPPASLPEGLEWPFEQNKNGEWARKV